MTVKFDVKFLYKIFIFLLIAMYMLEATSITVLKESLFHNILKYTALLVAIICIIYRKYSSKEFIIICSLLLIGLFCYISSGLSGLFMTMLAITLMPKDSFDNILNMIFIEEIILFGIIVALSVIGVLDIGLFEIYKGAYTISALSLGFGHPNMLAAQGTSIILLWLCVNRNRLMNYHYLFSTIGIFLIYACSKGRTAFLLGVITIFLLFCTKKESIKNKLMEIFPYSYVIILALLSLIMLFYARYQNVSTIADFINDVLFNGRIGLAYMSLLVYPITLFGKALDYSIWNEYQYFALDNGQVMLLLQFGIVGFLAYFYTIQKTLIRIKKEKEVVFGIVMSVFLIWSMYEGTMYFIGKNFALLFIGTKGFSSRLDINDKGGAYDS